MPRLNQKSFDVLGNIAVVKFPKSFKLNNKKQYAKKIMQENKSIKTVLEKIGKVKGRLRKQKTRYIAGEKNKEVLYRENNCVFRFNIDCCFFSQRLSNERKEIARKMKPGDEVLVMFAGVAPFSIIIAKNSKAKKIVSNEINREANKYAKLNIELNKVKDKVEIVSGDIKKVAQKFKKQGKKFDVIVMPRPKIKETFLRQAFMLSKKLTKVYYYDFCNVNELNLVVEKIKQKARKARKKIKILKTKKAGEIAPYKIRARVDFELV